MNDTTLYDPGYDSSHEGNGESVINMELEWSFSIVVAMMWKDIEECANKVKRLSRHVRNLEYWTDPL